ncbi:MAG: hypothetical protein KIT73_12665 [Burkholderiales bacterium]|nr:hypothetical protein [Burkholderiales bacterium]
MSWQSFTVHTYEAVLVAPNTPGYPNVHSFIRLYWGGKTQATLWFYADGTANIPANTSGTQYYARFRQSHYSACVDLLRNEKPVAFQWNEQTKGAFLVTGPEPVGDGELP